MKRRLTTILALMLSIISTTQAQDFESAKVAVKNMGVGWNLGNTLDACSGGAQGLESETYWGQPVTKPELMKMMKEAGFSAIRVPVTWYNHMDADGKVDEAWMKRVHEVVDYVIKQDLYCIVNVHHDTGDGSQWLHASTTTYNKVKTKFEYLWKQIASEFKDYDQKLLFESYNEMLDDNNRWNEPATDDGYKAINSYAKSFVTTVRNTGGNNKNRNLIVNVYSASSAPNAMKALELPENSGHIIFQMHTYPNWQNETNAKREIDNLMSNIKSNLLNRAPVIIGEYATFTTWPSTIDYYDTNRQVALYAMDYLVKQAKAAGIATFYWMGLSDGIYRSEPAFNQADLAQTLIKAYYGSTDGYIFPTHDSSKETVVFEGQKVLEWGQGVTVQSSFLVDAGSNVEVKLTYKLDFTDYDDIQFMYNKGGWTKIPDGLSIDGVAFSGADFSASGFYGISSGDTKTSTLTFDAAAYELVSKNDLVIQGHGVIVNKVTVGSPGASSIRPTIVDGINATTIYNLQGQRINTPKKGIYIRNGQKYIAK